MRLHQILACAVTTTALVAGGAYAATAGDSDGDIAASYAFAPYDRPKLMDFSDEVFLARVVERIKTIEDEGNTVWAVDILDSIKGERRGGRVSVEQHGYVDGRGRAHQVEDSPILEAGREYLLLTGRQPDGSLFLLSSPDGSPRADTPEQKAALTREYTAAAIDSGLTIPAGRDRQGRVHSATP